MHYHARKWVRNSFKRYIQTPAFCGKLTFPNTLFRKRPRAPTLCRLPSEYTRPIGNNQELHVDWLTYLAGTFQFVKYLFSLKFSFFQSWTTMKFSTPLQLIQQVPTQSLTWSILSLQVVEEPTSTLPQLSQPPCTQPASTLSPFSSHNLKNSTNGQIDIFNKPLKSSKYTGWFF